MSCFTRRVITGTVCRFYENLLLKPVLNVGNIQSQVTRNCHPHFVLGVKYCSTYRAAVLKEFGKPLVIDQVKKHGLKKDQIRIRVYCCGLNSLDKHNVAGEIDPKPKLPFIPGFEICGEILEIKDLEGDSKLFKPGERVIAFNSEFSGGCAQEAIVSRKDVWVVDTSMSFEEGASLINSYATAMLALTRRAEVKEGDTVLINGAGGRVGLALVDLAVNVYKCKVIAVCQTDDRASAVRDRGAFATVIMSKQNVVQEVKKLTEDKGVKIVIDTVGGNEFKKVVECAADEAKIVVAGFASTNIPQITGDELMEKSFSIIGVSLDQYRKRQYDVYKSSVAEIIELSKEGLIRPHKAKHFPLEDINKALEILRDKNFIGKFVIDIP